MRTISADEYDFLLKVESVSGKNFHSLGLSQQSLVESMTDGGMGSIKFIADSNSSAIRSLGSVLVQGEFEDADGVTVSFAINLDKDGSLFELDLWRVDFAELQQLPETEGAVKVMPVTA